MANTNKPSSILRDAIAHSPGEIPERYTHHLSRALVGLAGGYFANSQLREAVMVCREATQLNPEYADGFYNLGLILLTLGDSAEAADALATALQLDPAHSQAHYGLGLALLRLGDRDHAMQVYEVLRELSPELAAQLGSYF